MFTDQFSASFPLFPKGRTILNSIPHSSLNSKSGVRFVTVAIPLDDNCLEISATSWGSPKGPIPGLNFYELDR